MEDPSYLNPAFNSPDCEKWKKAMKTEIDAIHENEVWELISPPKDCKPVESKWVFERKLDSESNVCTYKARLVAKDFSQQKGVNYDETFAALLHFDSVRSLMSIAVQFDFELHQMDVSSSFLNGELEEDIFMSQSEGFVIPDKEEFVLHLKKSLYALKQSLVARTNL